MMNMPASSISPTPVKAFELTGFGYDHLRSTERPIGAVGPGEVRVRIRAASLNYRDHVVITGGYGVAESALPFIPVSDGAGEVIEVGEGVERLKLGDRVTTLMTRDWISGPLTPERHAAQNGGPLDGVLAETVVLPERALAHFSEHLSFAEAACLPIAALTAWTALTESGLHPGQTVLATGSGNVSLFALQLGRLWGARIIVTSGDVAARGPKLKAMGAHAVIDYRAEDWAAQVVAANDGRGVDLAIENGGFKSAGGTLDALRQGGYVAFVGLLALDGQPVPDLTVPFLMKNVRARGVLTGSRDAYEALQRVVGAHAVRPVIDSRFPLADVRAAFDRAFKERPFGKVVIEL
jgi:NADPH:quinone reductase-like Zn-dependent oxidoreductase